MKEKSMKRCVLIGSALFLVLAVSGIALAFDQPPTFKISGLFWSDAQNMHCRVLSDTPTIPLCTGGPTNAAWAYINESDSGAKGKIAGLMTAYALGKSVNLTTESVPVGAATYCHIVEFSIW
jgi:hypothetical protein